MYWNNPVLYKLILLWLLTISFQLSVQIEHCENTEDFRCSKDLCIKQSYVCNGEKDCPNNWDEENCDFKLCRPPTWYQCKDNQTCIAYLLKCDGHNDCPGNDDEEICKDHIEHHVQTHCSTREFTCMSDKTCLPFEYVCDGKKQCLDGSDETMGCLEIEKRCGNEFLCASKKHCVSSFWVCDGHDDCGDNSDEKFCPDKCLVDKKEFLCKNGKSCISIDRVCDKKTDCDDGSDEADACLKYSNNTDCHCGGRANCYILPTGPVCVCPNGFTYNKLTKTCDDIDECLEYKICSQGCVNTIGSYRCKCADDFELKSDNKSCVANKQTEALLLFAGHKAVNGYFLKSKHQYIVSKNVHQVVGIGYDGRNVYWTDIAMRTESIMRAKEDGSNLEVVLTSGLSAPEDIAIDWLTGNIYFTDGAFMHIAVCSNDGYHCTALYNKDVQRPRGICLYPQKGLMFWSDWGDVPMIVVAGMDGNFPKVLVQDDIHWPNGLALDWPNGRIYWVDAKLKRIDSINIDGTDRHSVLEGVIKHPFGIAIFENSLYWSDWDTASIQACDKFSGKNRRTIVKDRTIYDIHIYHDAMQPMGKSACIGRPCTHLCLLAINGTFTCACPKGMVLNIDQRTCKSSVKKQTLLLGISNYLIFWKHQSFGKHDRGHGEPLAMMIHKMAFNSITGDIFVADNIKRIIYTVDLKTKEATELINTNIGNVTSLQFDHLGNNLYWADAEHNSVEIYSLQYKHRAVVFRYQGNTQILALALLPQEGKMFVALRFNTYTHMDVQPMHGRGGYHHIIENGLSKTGHIQYAVNKNTNEIYWFDSTFGNIAFTDLSADLGYHVFVSNIKQPVSIAVLGDEVFWTVSKSFKLYWASTIKTATNAETKQIIIDLPDYVSVPDEIVLLATTPLTTYDHMCKQKIKSCSHICVPTGITSFACLCPMTMTFKDFKNVTCIDRIDCEYRCRNGECLMLSRYCNGQVDCTDSSDEEMCTQITTTPKTCEYNQFKCVDDSKCIDQKLRCDMNFDCVDKSDESDCNQYDHARKCHKYQHACGDGRCVDITALCDGYKDCEDGSDEKFCDNKKICDSTMFKCLSGQCIPKEWRCDRHADCIDDSDELYCPKKSCPANFFTCTHGECIDKRLVCDDHNDCGDNSDEKNCNRLKENESNDGIICGEIVSFDREPTKFQCSSNKSICLDISVKCNGSAECPRGEDEVGCSGCTIHEFECKNKQCIRTEWRCDKESDCNDGSDEENCTQIDINGRLQFHIYKKDQETDDCHEGMFDCKDGSCTDLHRVCDGIEDCANKVDESGLCNVSCVASPCAHKCIKSPYGPTCDCNQGYKLGPDNKQCIDIDECQQEMKPCAQLCDNTIGSFTCSCFRGYFLRTDKASCKPLGEPQYLLHTSFNTIWKISPNLEILLETNSSRITGMDVNVEKNLLYFSVAESGCIYEYQMANDNKFNIIENVGKPYFIAVDWIAENIYFIDDSSVPTLKVCHVANKVCIHVYQFKYKDIVKNLIIDSFNRHLFTTIIHYLVYSTPESVIYRMNLDGSKPEILIKETGIITSITNDINKRIIYYVEINTKSVWAVNYDGTGKRSIIKGSRQITKPNSINFFADHLTLLNDASSIVVQCPIYGERQCNIFHLSVSNPENLVIVQKSRQKTMTNSCSSNDCNLICINADKGYKCLCDGGSTINPGLKCPKYVISPTFKTMDTTDVEMINMNNNEESGVVGRTTAIFLSFLCATVLIMGAYYIYRKRLSHGRFNISMYFQYPRFNRNGTPPQVKMFNTPEVRTTHQYNELFLEDASRNLNIDNNNKQVATSTDYEDGETTVDLNQFNENQKARLIH